MLPLPRFATRPWFFVFLALLHVYMGGGHLQQLLQHPISWTDIWKGLGATFGAYYFIALAARSSASPGTSKSSGENSGRISTSPSVPSSTPTPNGARLAHSIASASVLTSIRK